MNNFQQSAFGQTEEITLRKGDSGEAVAELQRLLIAQGSTLRINGVFDAATLAAVISIQQKCGIPVDGIVNSQTWKALQKMEC